MKASYNAKNNRSTEITDSEESTPKDDQPDHRFKGRVADNDPCKRQNLVSYTRITEVLNRHTKEQDSLIQMMQDNNQVRRSMVQNAQKMLEKYKVKEQKPSVQSKDNLHYSHLKFLKPIVNPDNNKSRQSNVENAYNFDSKNSKTKSKNTELRHNKLSPMTCQSLDMSQWSPSVTDDIEKSEDESVETSIVRKASFFESNVIEVTTKTRPKNNARVIKPNKSKEKEINSSVIVKSAMVSENDYNFVKGNHNVKSSVHAAYHGKENSEKRDLKGNLQRRDRTKLPPMENRKSGVEDKSKDKSVDLSIDGKTKEKVNGSLWMLNKKGITNTAKDESMNVCVTEPNLNYSYDATTASRRNLKQGYKDLNNSVDGKREIFNISDSYSPSRSKPQIKPQIRIVKPSVKTIQPQNSSISVEKNVEPTPPKEKKLEQKAKIIEKKPAQPQQEGATEVSSKKSYLNFEKQDKNAWSSVPIEKKVEKPNEKVEEEEDLQFYESRRKRSFKQLSEPENIKPFKGLNASFDGIRSSSQNQFLTREGNASKKVEQNITFRRQSSRVNKDESNTASSILQIPEQKEFNLKSPPSMSSLKAVDSSDSLQSSETRSHCQPFGIKSKEARALSLKRWEKVDQESYKVYQFTGRRDSPTFEALKNHNKPQRAPKTMIRVSDLLKSKENTSTL